MADEQQLDMQIVGVESGDLVAGARKIIIRTNRGQIPLILHESETPSRVALCVCGAIGGFDGPSMLYPRLGLEMPRKGISIARANYRAPNDFGECLLDALAALTFLKGTGYERAAIIGHSFGGAVAINAGTLSPVVSTVIAISSQLAGAHVIADLSPKPLLLIHGTADTVLPDQCSRMLYKRAGEPKTLKLFDGADHRLSQVGDELFTLVEEWIAAKI
jgi:pimeloyl-ACP methyl ester carboxylesterase